MIPSIRCTCKGIQQPIIFLQGSIHIEVINMWEYHDRKSLTTVENIQCKSQRTLLTFLYPLFTSSIWTQPEIPSKTKKADDKYKIIAYKGSLQVFLNNDKINWHVHVEVEKTAPEHLKTSKAIQISIFSRVNTDLILSAIFLSLVCLLVNVS